MSAEAPTQSDPSNQAPRSPLLARLTSLTAVTSFAALAMILVGVGALIAGDYTKQVVHDQLEPQKIFFPEAGSEEMLPGIEEYAGEQLTTGAQAKAYANEYIGVHLEGIAGGKTYAEVSSEAMAKPNDAELEGQKTALFQGETLRGLLLSAWGWSVVGEVATVVGIILVVGGAVLFILPILNWRINLRRRKD